MMEGKPIISSRFMKQSFQRLTEKIMDRYLDVHPSKHDTKASSMPPVQTDTLYPIHTANDVPAPESKHVRQFNLPQSVDLLNLIYFLEATGCRISEALNLNSNDILSSGLVKVCSLKGSQPRLLHSGSAMPYLLEQKKRGLLEWHQWSRQFVYREFLKLGIGGRFGVGSKKSVTHFFRHSIAMSIKNAGLPISDSKQFLGHKSEKSTEFYHGRQLKKS